MDIKKFVSDFAEQFDETNPSEIKEDTVYKELDEWSSLLALSIIAMVDEEYDISIKGEDIVNSKTIEDLFKIVSSKT